MPSPDSPAGGAGGPSAPAGQAADRAHLERLIRSAAGGVYGVAAVGRPGRWATILGRLGLSRGVTIGGDPGLTVEIDLALVPGVPVAQVARNVEEAVRYLVQRDGGHTIDELVVRVDGQPVSSRGAAGGDRTPAA